MTTVTTVERGSIVCQVGCKFTRNFGKDRENTVRTVALCRLPYYIIISSCPEIDVFGFCATMVSASVRDLPQLIQSPRVFRDLIFSLGWVLALLNRAIFYFQKESAYENRI